jgi:hypothetical protein
MSFHENLMAPITTALLLRGGSGYGITWRRQ